MTQQSSKDLGQSPSDSSSDETYDDFHKLSRFINEERISILHEANIWTYKDIDTAAARKVLAGFGFASSTVDRIQREARELAAKKVQQQNVDSATAEGGKDTNSSTQTKEKPKQVIALSGKENAGQVDPSTIRNGQWECLPRAFLVEFWIHRLNEMKQKGQVRVFKCNVDKKGSWGDNGVDMESPKDIEGERLYSWMREQLGESWPESREGHPIQGSPAEETLPELQPELKVSEAPTSATSPTETPLAETPPVDIPPTDTALVKVEVTQIRVFQPPESDTPIGIEQAGRRYVGLIHRGEPFVLAVSFNLAGEGAADLAAKQVRYPAHFYTHSISTGEKLPLGDTQPEVLVEDKLAFIAKLAQVTLPAGIYLLRTLVPFPDASVSRSYLDIPILQVV